MVPILGIIILSRFLQLEMLEGIDFNYDYNIFKFQYKNTQIRHFWIQI